MGAGSKVYSFIREYFSGKKENIEFESLGYISHGNYLSRTIPFITAVNKIKKELHNSNCLYAFGLDCALLGIVCNIFTGKDARQIIIYECADIRSVFIGSKLKNKLFRFIERWVMKHCHLIVTTSPAFVDEYFLKIQKLDSPKIFLLENKIKEPVPKPLRREKWNGEKPLVIGYFGLLRCQRSFQILVELVRRYPEKFNLYIRGYDFGLEDLEKVIKNEYNIEYGGSYVNPDDLGEMYGKVDLVWAAYLSNDSPEGTNRRWAMRNQFFEAIYYRTPMVIQYNTLAAARVCEFQIGIEVDMNNINKTISSLNAITPTNLQTWGKNIIKLPPHLYIYSDEHKKLAQLIGKKLRK